MVLKPEAMRERLLRLEEVVSRLEELRDLPAPQLHGQFQNMWAVERGLQLAAEIAFDIGNHILSAHFGTSARDYEEIIALLGAKSVLTAPLAESLKGLGGFRNILVHGYLTIDPEKVTASLQRAPTQFSEFARDIRRWLEATVGS